MSKSAPARLSTTHLEHLWLQHKEILHRLYIAENKTLREVKDAMETGCNFPVLR